MAGDWYELNDGGSFSIAGYQGYGEAWEDVEKGDETFEDSHLDPSDLEIVVFHYQGEDGADVYFTLYGPFDDLDGLADLIEDCLDRYGVE